MKDNLIKKSYVSAFGINDSSLKNLIIINTKCLVDDATQRYVYVDNNRLKDELKYFNFYDNKIEYNSILNILLPVVLSNTNIKKSEDECVSLIQKYIKYFKKEEYLFDFILGSVIYNCIIHTLLENKNIEYEELLQLLKEKLINFTLELDKLSTVKFQMTRIRFMQKIDRYIDMDIEEYDDTKILETLLNILYDIYIENREVYDDGINSTKKSILSILGEETNVELDNIDFIYLMSDYITKLKTYNINKKTYSVNADPRNLISLNQGESILDPILNKITVVSKEFDSNILRLKISSKSGIYSFNFKKS